MTSDWDTSKLGGSIKRNIVNPDLLEEHQKCNFDKKEFANFVLGENIVDEMNTVYREIGNDPNMRVGLDFYEMTREEQMATLWRVTTAVFNNPQLRQPYFLQNSERKNWSFSWSYLAPGITVIGLHQTMFTKSIKFLANEEQQKRWLPMINSLQILGCYAQTEMGHGSNVAGIETTATFDKNTDEFVIHTPNIRATKFWAGGLGKHATHAVVMCRLILDGNPFGVLPFMVPIRSRVDHTVYPGIEVGDVGTKLGYNTVDNGYLSFN